MRAEQLTLLGKVQTVDLFHFLTNTSAATLLGVTAMPIENLVTLKFAPR